MEQGYASLALAPKVALEEGFKGQAASAGLVFKAQQEKKKATRYALKQTKNKSSALRLKLKKLRYKNKQQPPPLPSPPLPSPTLRPPSEGLTLGQGLGQGLGAPKIYSQLGEEQEKARVPTATKTKVFCWFFLPTYPLANNSLLRSVGPHQSGYG